MELSHNVIALSINSMQFGKRNLKTNDEEAPQLIFNWLKQKLNMARQKNKKVLMVYHLPNGIISTVLGFEKFWLPIYDEKFQQILKEYNDVIAGIYTGHTHNSALNVSSYKVNMQNKARHYGGIIVNRAVSPHYQNNPGFTIFHYLDSMNYPEYYVEYTMSIECSYNITLPGREFWSYLYDSRLDLNIRNLSPEGIREFLYSPKNDLKKHLKYTLYRVGMKPFEFPYIQMFIEGMCKAKTRNSIEQSVCNDSLRDYISTIGRKEKVLFE